MKTVQYILPTFWAAYLFNDDCDDMTNDEVIDCNDWLRNRNLPAPCDIEDYGFMINHDANTIVLACDCSTYTFLIPDEVTS